MYLIIQFVVRLRNVTNSPLLTTFNNVFFDYKTANAAGKNSQKND